MFHECVSKKYLFSRMGAAGSMGTHTLSSFRREPLRAEIEMLVCRHVLLYIYDDIMDTYRIEARQYEIKYWTASCLQVAQLGTDGCFTT